MYFKIYNEDFLSYYNLYNHYILKREFYNESIIYKNTIDFGFYNEYVSGQGIEIQQFDRGAPEKPVYIAKLMDCYPSLVGASTMSWQTPDVLRQSVTISYRYFTDEFIGRPDVANVSADSLFARLNKSGAGGLINMGVGRLAEKVGTKATAAAIFAAGKLMK